MTGLRVARKRAQYDNAVVFGFARELRERRFSTPREPSSPGGRRQMQCRSTPRRPPRSRRLPLRARVRRWSRCPAGFRCHRIPPRFLSLHRRSRPRSNLCSPPLSSGAWASVVELPSVCVTLSPGPSPQPARIDSVLSAPAEARVFLERRRCMSDTSNPDAGGGVVASSPPPIFPWRFAGLRRSHRGGCWASEPPRGGESRTRQSPRRRCRTRAWGPSRLSTRGS